MALALVPPPPATEFLKVVKNLVPGIGRIELPGGAIVALAALAPEVDAVLEANIERHLRRKTRKKNDGSKVLKIKDAIDCVDQHLGNGKALLTLAKTIISVAVDPGLLQKGSFTDPVAACFREKALGQTNKRSFGIYKKTKGPGIPKDKTYTELVNLRRGKLHPFIPK